VTEEDSTSKVATDVSVSDDSSAELSRAQGESADARYRRLLEHSPDAVCVHQAGRVVYVNRAGLRWMAADTPEQLVGNMITEFVDPESIPTMLARISELRRQGDISDPSEAVMLKFDGTRLDVEAVSVLTVWNGEPAYQVTFRDISTQKTAQASLRYQAALVDHASDAIIATTLTGEVTSWNPAAESIYGRPAATTLGEPVGEAVGAELNPQKVIVEGGVITDVHHAADGTALSVRVSVAAMDDGYVLLCSDQTALRRAERHFESVVSSLDEGVLVLDHTGAIMSVNPAVFRLLGAASDGFEAGYRELSRAWTDEWRYAMYGLDGTPIDTSADPPVVRTFRDGVPFQGEARKLGPPNGGARWLAVSTRRLNPEDGARSPVLIAFRDITAARMATEKFAHQALHDPLTGLPNRTQLIESMERLRAEGTLTAVLFVDLDDLKGVNDSLGHDAGDLVIQAAAQRLRHAVRKDDVVCRLAGDEFVVLLVGHLDDAELAAVTARIRTMASEPVSVAGFTVHMGASIGVVHTEPQDARDANVLLRLADRAMYAAKAGGRRTVVFTTVESV
jgi:diguanylate cyclase (GGDEF)-like protein/PAS domain S-box-containing protein